MNSPTQFGLKCLGVEPTFPTEKEKSDDQECWLCGGNIKKGTRWKLKTAISSTFTNHNQAKAPHSGAVCPECVFFSGIESWRKYVESLGTTKLKTSKVTAWRSYSHVFSKSHHLCPTRSEWRDILLSPPEPPFVFVVAVSSQKHLIFRSKISYSRDRFHVKFEEDDFYIRREMFAEILEKFERFYNLGFSKASILFGNYNQAQILKVGLKIWKEYEEIFKIWRAEQLETLRLVEFCAQKEENADKK